MLSDHQLEKRILVFRHPLAGLQLVKGTIEDNEQAADAAIREMKEESGIDSQISHYLGHVKQKSLNQEWEVFLVEPANDLPETWEFQTMDDGGKLFTFFWEPLSKDFSNDSKWDERYVRIIDFLKESLYKLETAE